ncbi:MAG: hypothetical protein IPM54_28295 [Polyangiaceae bacterium]|nr:hypothetical protein [Polyangiaceae bacterium]
MRSWFKATAGALVVATITGLSAMADATTALFLGREDLVRISDVVVRVKVGKATVRESDDKATILTRTDIEVTQCLKGPCSARFVVEQFGGTYNGKTQRVLGDGKLVPGEDAVVFLKKGDNGTAYLTVLAQSVYHVDAKGMARRTMDGLTLVQRKGDRMKPILVTEVPETVESLMTDVKRLAGGK